MLGAVVAYEPEAWHELFVMVGGASAALAGLLFVAVSLNLEHVLRYRSLPTLAASSMSLLVAVVMASVFGLVPGQPTGVLGVELLALGAAVAALQLVPTVRGLRGLPGDRAPWKAWRIAAALIATVPLLTAGASLVAGAGGGLYWVLAWVIVALAVSTFNAWVLLVEIRR